MSDELEIGRVVEVEQVSDHLEARVVEWRDPGAARLDVGKTELLELLQRDAGNPPVVSSARSLIAQHVRGACESAHERSSQLFANRRVGERILHAGHPLLARVGIDRKRRVG